jgi:prepilin-type processing-associated H-X9-DG protein
MTNKLEVAYVVRLNGKGKGSIEYLEPCEYDCENLQTSPSAANYGMCDGHYKGSLWYCSECKSDEGQWCQHKETVEA